MLLALTAVEMDTLKGKLLIPVLKRGGQANGIYSPNFISLRYQKMLIAGSFPKFRKKLIYI
ncbi:hypothetical protein AO275_21605 [Pseudomonas viridiflava]|nr:hypothetical protein AO275_21605 [Pseudomonas viridiflava]